MVRINKDTIIEIVLGVSMIVSTICTISFGLAYMISNTEWCQWAGIVSLGFLIISGYGMIEFLERE